MLIKCPFCQTEAHLPESKEGAKVRCGDCEKVYTARPKGVRGKQQDANTTMRLAIGAGAIVVLGIVFALVRRNGSDGTRPVVAATGTAPVAAPEAPVRTSPWDSAPVRVVRDVYAAVAAYDDARTASQFDLARVHDARAAEGASLFAALDPAQAAAFKELLLDELTDRSLPEALGSWEPFDGEVIHQTDGEVLVHVRVTGLSDETSLETRTMAWSLVRDPQADGPWQVTAWERVLTEAEARALRRVAAAHVEYVELSDGSTVFESAPAPLDHLESTPPELRTRIDRLCVQLIDLSLDPRDNADAKLELVEIGGPALPGLLTSLVGIKLETQDEAIQVNLLNQCLEEITGHYTGYKPNLKKGSALGTTAERRESAVKQWFAWWHRKGAKFVAAPTGEGDEASGASRD